MSTMHGWWRIVGLGLALLACAVEAHHSIAGVYENARRLTLTGVIVEFRFIRPHPFLVLHAAGDAREPEAWQLEMDNHSELVEIGIAADTFKPGDRVVATGSPGRDGARRLYLRRLDRPADGLRYEQIGYRPIIDVARDSPP